MSKNALYNEVEELTKKLDRQKKKTDEWEMAYCEQEHLAEGFCEENKKLKQEMKSLALIMKSSDDVREECIKGYREQVEKLKEENKKLEDHLHLCKVSIRKELRVLLNAAN